MAVQTDKDDSVSIIIAAYNSGTTIARAVNSALAEKQVTNVIVVDDASSDDTVARAHAADDGTGRLVIHRQNRNAGPSAARNVALRECKSDWIGILDADDFFLPDRIQGLLQFSAQAEMIADDIWRVDEHNIDGARHLFLGADLTTPRLIGLQEFILSNITNSRRPRGELGFIKPLIRRSFLETYSLRYQEQMRLGEDYELYARALAHGAKLLLVPAQGYVSVVRAHSLSGQHSPEDLRQLRDCDVQLSALPGLTHSQKKALRRHYLSIDCRLQWRLLIDAVKRRDLNAIAAIFMRPYPVPLYLLRQLGQQLALRTVRHFRVNT